MASINSRKNSDGSRSYVAQVRLKGFETSSKFFRETDYPSRREAEKAAEAWAEAKEAQLRELRARGGVRSDIAVLTLRDLVGEYLKDPETTKLAGFNARHLHLCWWVERYGSVKALEFASPVRLRDAREELRRDHGPATCNRYLASIRAAHNWGRATGLLPTNAAWVPRLMLTEPKGRETFLSDEELARVLKEAQAHSKLMGAAVMFAVGVGCRQSEQLRVRWGDIDESTATVAIRVSKTNTSRRAHLPPAVVTALKGLHGANVRPLPFALVFADGEGKPIKQHWLIDRWEKIRAAAGVPSVRWHDLRHSAASFLAQNGASLIEIATQLGHLNTATTRRYSHLVAGQAPTGADKLDAKLRAS